MSISTRPWGYFRILAFGNKYLVKELVIYPGQQTSLQKHYHRAERWIIAEGTGVVQVEVDLFPAISGSMFVIKPEELHRASNVSDNGDLRIIEVQHGEVPNEEDIERIEDDYGRAG